MPTAVTILVSGVVALFGVTSAVLGFIAEADRLKRDEIYVSGGDCVYPAHTLGLCAIFLLVVAQIIATAAGGCCGYCCKPPGGASSNYTRRRVVGVLASALSWVAAAIAVSYWLGAVAPHTLLAKIVDPNEECYLYRGGIFVRAAVLSLVATSLGIKSCLLLRLPAAKDAPPEQDQHVVGLPQWPAQGSGKQVAYPYPTKGYGQASDAKLAPPPQGHDVMRRQ